MSKKVCNPKEEILEEVDDDHDDNEVKFKSSTLKCTLSECGNDSSLISSSLDTLVLDGG